ncbi:MAG: cofactor-independent phosphoglycerate mutase [Actinomycetota bacterium]|nr:cofactor-independent phosphoglycerate mutase [Actinomycetota bacterium]
MKYLILIGDGMADRPLPSLGGKTPLQAARTPNMDRLAREGFAGAAVTLPKGLPNGSDVANLSILGYDPRQYYTGRAPFEAASMGIDLAPNDVAFRCNLVTIGRNAAGNQVMEDHSAGQLTSAEGKILIEALNTEVAGGGCDIKFYPGVSYRNIMIWPGGKAGAGCTPPHDILGKEIAAYMPRGEGAELISKLMDISMMMLENHPVNKERISKGKRPANSIWLWGQGLKPGLKSFNSIYGKKGAMISAVDLTKGLAVAAGLSVINVPGATGYLDTNYKGKAEYALKALKDVDLVYVHVEAPDEASHEGKAEEKIKAIEDFDRLVVGTILEGLQDDCRVLLMPDHATPTEVRTHTAEPVPFVIWESGKKQPGFEGGYNESITAAGKSQTEAHKLMGLLIKGELS